MLFERVFLSLVFPFAAVLNCATHHQPGSVNVQVTIPFGSVFTLRVICSSGGSILGGVAL